MIFVGSMSNLFHEDVSEDFIKAVFDTTNQAHRHTFQVLTKDLNEKNELVTCLK